MDGYNVALAIRVTCQVLGIATMVFNQELVNKVPGRSYNAPIAVQARKLNDYNLQIPI